MLNSQLRAKGIDPNTKVSYNFFNYSIFNICNNLLINGALELIYKYSGQPLNEYFILTTVNTLIQCSIHIVSY